MDTTTIQNASQDIASYDAIPADAVIEKTAAALRERGFSDVLIVMNRAEALEKIKSLVPAGASIMNGSSRTLEEIGFVDYLKAGQHGWNNFHETILAEKDPAKQSALRKQSVLSDYYLGSVHALVENGQALIASNSGSQLPHIVYTSSNIIFVIGAQKIVSTLEAAWKRLEEYVIPLEDAHMMAAHNVHTYPSKIVLFNREPSFSGRAIRVIIVKEKLGF